jgi:uncharacterized repeat protein (TIGR02543 family)
MGIRYSLGFLRLFLFLFIFTLCGSCGGGGSDGDGGNHTVTYLGNNNTGGNVPTDSSIYQQANTVTVLGNTGSLVKTGYVFCGWNTKADGSGTSYAAGSTFAMATANVTLYAQWAINIAGTWTSIEIFTNKISGDCPDNYEVDSYPAAAITQNGNQFTGVVPAGATGSVTGTISGNTVNITANITLGTGQVVTGTEVLTVSSDGQSITGTLHQASTSSDVCTGDFRVVYTKQATVTDNTKFSGTYNVNNSTPCGNESDVLEIGNDPSKEGADYLYIPSSGPLNGYKRSFPDDDGTTTRTITTSGNIVTLVGQWTYGSDTVPSYTGYYVFTFSTGYNSFSISGYNIKDDDAQCVGNVSGTGTRQ